MISKRIYPAKVLLFGEYTVLHGAQAFAIPYRGRCGKWEIAQPSVEYEKLFQPFVEWLREKHREPDFVALDIDRITSDFMEHLIYQTNILNGYGMGSSGALTAAIYDRYITSAPAENLPELRHQLAQIEAFFHGKSSGIDPLVSYTQTAILKERNHLYRRIDQFAWPEHWRVWLINSGRERTTQRWVDLYTKKLSTGSYRKLIENQLIPHVEHAIQYLTQNASEHLWPHLEMISQFQLIHFSEMIPYEMKQIWDLTTSIPDLSMKLCGAGGGGYFLLFSKRKDLPKEFPILQKDLISLDMHLYNPKHYSARS